MGPKYKENSGQPGLLNFKTLMQEFSIGSTGIGILSSSYYIACVAFQIPFGFALDVWGPKRTLRISMVCCAVGILVFTLAPCFQWMIVGRVLLGLSGASVFLSGIRLNMLWFKQKYWGLSSGALTAIGKIGGGMLSSIAFPLLMMCYSWRTVSYVLLIAGCVLTVVNFKMIKNGPKDAFAKKRVSFRLFIRSMMRDFSNPIVWTMGIYGYAMYLVLSVFGETYAIDFLTQSVHLSRQQAGFMSSLTFLGSALGSFFISYASDALGQRKSFLCMGAVGALVSSSFVFFYPNIQYATMAAAIFFFGFFSGSGILVFVTAVESSRTQNPGSLMGIVNCIVMSSGLVHNVMCGTLIDVVRSHAASSSLSLTEYHVSFLTITAMLLFATVIAFTFKESSKTLKNI